MFIFVIGHQLLSMACISQGAKHGLKKVLKNYLSVSSRILIALGLHVVGYFLDEDG
jgi:hypothetical protein